MSVLKTSIIIPLSAALLSGCTAANPSQKPVETATTLCEQTVRAYGPLRDNGPVEDYGALFTDDATFTLGDVVTRGRADLMARHNVANAQNTFTHFMQDVHIDASPDGLRGDTRFILYIGAKNPADTSIHRQIIGHYKDVFTVTARQCRIQSRQIEIIFDTAERSDAQAKPE